MGKERCGLLDPAVNAGCTPRPVCERAEQHTLLRLSHKSMLTETVPSGPPGKGAASVNASFPLYTKQCLVCAVRQRMQWSRDSGHDSDSCGKGLLPSTARSKLASQERGISKEEKLYLKIHHLRVTIFKTNLGLYFSGIEDIQWLVGLAQTADLSHHCRREPYTPCSCWPPPCCPSVESTHEWMQTSALLCLAGLT